MIRTIISCVAMVAVYFVLPLDADTSATELITRILATLAGIALATWLISRQIARQLRERDTPLFGLLLATIGGILVFAMADYMVAVSVPGQFAALQTRLDALYFALSTLATVGFGDVHAQGQVARAVVSMQIVFNVAVLATAGSLLAKQVLQRRARPHHEP